MNPTNAMMIITPYRSGGTWVFDDPNAGLVAEPFVAGAPAMIDQVIEVAGIEPSDARRDGVRLLFSANPFPGFHKEALRAEPLMGGN